MKIQDFVDIGLRYFAGLIKKAHILVIAHFYSLKDFINHNYVLKRVDDNLKLRKYFRSLRSK